MSNTSPVGDAGEAREDTLEKLEGHELPDWIATHLQDYATNPEKAHYWDATFAGGHAKTPCLLLTTTGRKSGKQITMPLIYGKDGDRHVIVASKGGAPEHPAWYRNLVAQPKADIQVVDKKYRVVARAATGEERKRLWAMMSEVYPPYPSYQEKTDREIPVVVLETIK